MQIAPIPQDEGKLSKVFRASSLPFCIFKCLTLFNTNTIENLDIKCLSVNTRGLIKSIKRRSFFRWIHNQNVHFTFLQETHSSKLSADVLSAEWGGKVFFCHGTTNSKGVMILINPKLDCKVEKCISDNNGRLIILDVALEDSHITLVNIYAPNDLSQQVKFFKLVQHHLQDFPEETVNLNMYPVLKSIQPKQKQCGWVPGETEQIHHINSNGRKNLFVPLAFSFLTILMTQIT